MTNKTILEFKNISKSFDKNKVLEDINFKLCEGEIIGLVGENGAGKSTLMKILSAMPEIHATGGYEGQIFYNNKEIKFIKPMDAIAAGIGMVHQEFSLIPGFNTVENIFINREKTHSTWLSEVFGDEINTLDTKVMKERTEKAVAHLGLELDLDMPISDMSVGFKQFVEIAREIEKDQTSLLVLDEPTAVLTETEAQLLIKAIKGLAAEGIAIIFISHRLQEITDLCDKVLVLRDGKITLNKPTTDIDILEITHAMVGRTIAERTNAVRDFSQAENILEVKDLWVNMPGEKINNANFTIKKGEIHGFAGMTGQGKLGIPCGLMGLEAAGGTMLYKGESLPFNDSYTVQKNKLAFVSEDRRGIGLLLEEDIAHNMILPAMIINGNYIKKIAGILPQNDNQKVVDDVSKMVQELNIKCTGIHQKVKELSGGNQQKVCLAKAFLLEPDLLFVSEPTRGIDIGAKAIVLEKLRYYSEKFGMTIVICSSELEELRSICDRISVVNEGRIAGTLDPTDSIELFGKLMVTIQ